MNEISSETTKYLNAEYSLIIKKIEEEVDSLVSSRFSPDHVSSFQIFIGEYLNQPLRSKIFLATLFDRAKALSKVVKRDEEQFSVFRNFIKTLLLINNEQILSYFETSLVNEKNLDKFFIFLEENIVVNRDITFIIDAFIQLMCYNNYSYISIQNFLKKISKDKKWLIHKLLSFNLYNVITNHIHETVLYEKDSLKEIVDALASYPKYEVPVQYARLVVFILQNTNEYLPVLLKHSDINEKLLESVIVSDPRPLAVKNYSIYLFENKGLEIFLSFEDKLLASEHISAYSVLEYSNQVAFSTKRSILKKLISLRAEQELIKFMKKFPEYKKLLMLL